MLSTDPLIQWCLEEALSARLDHERAKAVERHEATANAHAQAQAMLARA